MSKSKEHFMNLREHERYIDYRHLDDGYYFDLMKMQHAEQSNPNNNQQHGNLCNREQQEKRTAK